MSLLGSVPVLSQLPIALFTFFDLTNKNEKLSDKEIYNVGEVMKPPGMVKAPSTANADPRSDKLVQQMAAKLVKAQKQIDDLHNKVNKSLKKKPVPGAASVGKVQALTKVASTISGKDEGALRTPVAPVARNEPLNPADQKFIESNIADLNQQ